MPPRTVDGAVAPDGTGLSLLGLVAIFLRRWKAVLAGIAFGLFLALVYIFVLPPVYAAHVVIVPSVERSSGSLLAASLPPGLASLAGGGNADQQKLIMAITRSRRLADSVYARVDGTEDRERREFFIRTLSDRAEVEQTAAGSFVIEVRDRDPEMAAAIANAYPPLINSISADLGRQVVSEKREFLANQLADASASLLQSEEQLLNYQRTTEAPAIEEQARQTVEAAAELQRKIMQKEVELAQLRRSATPSNPELQRAASELETLRGQLRALTGGQSTGAVFVPLQESPELKAGEVRLLREYATNEQIYLALTAGLAETQIDARTNLPVVSVLDSATVPTVSARLPAGTVLFLLGWLGIIIGLLVALLVEYLARLRRDPESAVLRNAWADLRGRLRRRGESAARA